MIRREGASTRNILCAGGNLSINKGWTHTCGTTNVYLIFSRSNGSIFNVRGLLCVSFNCGASPHHESFQKICFRQVLVGATFPPWSRNSWNLLKSSVFWLEMMLKISKFLCLRKIRLHATIDNPTWLVEKVPRRVILFASEASSASTVAEHKLANWTQNFDFLAIQRMDFWC